MVWIFPAFAGLVIILWAMRSARFRRFAEPALGIIVAIGLVSAFIVWRKDANMPTGPSAQPSAENGEPALSAQSIALEELTFTPKRPDTSYRLTGTVFNKSEFNLDYFRVSVILEDCPNGACKTLGEDNALILSRIPAGKRQAFETFFTFPNPYNIEPTAPKWSYTVTDVRGTRP